MEKTKKPFYKIFYLVLLALIVLAGYFFYRSKSGLINKPAVQQQRLTVYLKLAGENNFSKSEIAVGKTALDLTKEKANVVTKGEGVNAYVIQINQSPDLRKMSLLREYWAFYLNGKLAEVGAGSYKLKEGDKIEWKLENY